MSETPKTCFLTTRLKIFLELARTWLVQFHSVIHNAYLCFIYINISLIQIKNIIQPYSFNEDASVGTIRGKFGDK